MRVFPCPYLRGLVELTDEREAHIVQTHPDLLPDHIERIGEVLADPDRVRRSTRMNSARLFSRWFDNVRQGKHVVVVVVSEGTAVKRHWIITAYLARRLASGEVEWSKD